MRTEDRYFLKRKKKGGSMYFETKLIKDARLSAMNDEELINLLNEAADKTNQDPDSFFIFPYGVYSDYIFLLIRTSFSEIGKASEFAEHCGLKLDNFGFDEISPEQYEVLSEGIGYDQYKKGCVEYPDSFDSSRIEYLTIPSKDSELFMPKKAEHPNTLVNELIFIAHNKKHFFSPINYYIVSADKRRQASIRMALLQSLKMHSWIDPSYYKTVSLDTKGGDYNPAMGDLDYIYYGERDYPIVLSINGDGILPQNDETLNSFVDTLIKYKDVNTTIIESKYFDERMMKALEERDNSIPFVLIKDTGRVRIPSSLPQNVFRSCKDYFDRLESKKDPRVYPDFHNWYLYHDDFDDKNKR